MTFVCRQVDSLCVRRTSPESLPEERPTANNGQRITIASPVGMGGANQRDDTRKIQDALNRVPLREGRPDPLLDVDGRCGPKTKKAIQSFQLKQFGWSGADGLVEPRKATIAKLNEVRGTISFPDMTPVVRRTRAWLTACEAHLHALDHELESENSPTRIHVFSREFKMRFVNKHFSLDAFANKGQMYHFILGTYKKMIQVFQRPGGLWAPAAFERDPLNRHVQAYTVGGGFFHPGQFVFAKGKKVRADSIYLCSRFANELRNDDRRAFVVIHELAHFVGFPQPIGDFAHNKQGAKIKNLSPNLKILNAESYANFAWEVVHGSEAPVF